MGELNNAIWVSFDSCFLPVAFPFNAPLENVEMLMAAASLKVISTTSYFSLGSLNLIKKYTLGDSLGATLQSSLKGSFGLKLIASC